jgi:hypothetical protein
VLALRCPCEGVYTSKRKRSHWGRAAGKVVDAGQSLSIALLGFHQLVKFNFVKMCLEPRAVRACRCVRTFAIYALGRDGIVVERGGWVRAAADFAVGLLGHTIVGDMAPPLAYRALALRWGVQPPSAAP